MADELRQFAVLIDADNTSPKIAKDLFEEIAKFGSATVRRVYGDFTASNMKGWIEALVPHAIVPRQEFANTKGKNASDIAMVIDAMDMLHANRFHGFCLVSSDSDFTGLAMRLREDGREVVGFGKKNTPESFRTACNRFIYLENLGTLMGEAEEVKSGANLKPETLNPSKAFPLIRKVFDELSGDNEWISLGELGQKINSIQNDFDTRTYGKAKLSDLLRAFTQIEMRKEAAGHLSARLKPARSDAEKQKG